MQGLGFGVEGVPCSHGGGARGRSGVGVPPPALEPLGAAGGSRGRRRSLEGGSLALSRSLGRVSRSLSRSLSRAGAFSRSLSRGRERSRAWRSRPMAPTFPTAPMCWASGSSAPGSERARESASSLRCSSASRACQETTGYEPLLAAPARGFKGVTGSNGRPQ